MGRGGGRSSSNYSPVYRTSYYRPEDDVEVGYLDYSIMGVSGDTGGICRVLWRHRRQKRTQEILDELADSVLKKYGEEDDE